MRGKAAGEREPEGRTGAGYARLETQVSCVITRFRLRAAWWLPWMWLAYRHIRRDARQVPGLLRTAFLVEDPRTCFVLSIWADDRALLDFGTRVDSHVHIARRTFYKTFDKRRRRAEIWSTQWRLQAVSNNLSWGDFDLRDCMDEAGRSGVDQARIQPHLKEAAR